MIKNISIYITCLAVAVVLLTPAVPVLAQEENEFYGEISKNREVYYNATSQKILGRLDKAAALFEQCLQLDPEDDASMYQLAYIYFSQGNVEKALPLAENAVKTEPGNEYYQVLLVQIYQSSARYEEAGKVLETLSGQHPGDPAYYQELAMNSLYMGDHKSALRYFNLIEEEIGILEEISLQKEKIYLMTGKVDKAIAEIRKLADSDPYESRYLELLAELYMSNGMTDLALETYNKILETDPGNPYINISLADYYRKQGEQQKSFEYLKQGFSNPNLDIDTKIQILLAYYTVNELYDTYKTDAFTLAGLLIKAHPDNPKSFSIYGDLLMQDKRYGEARDVFRKVITIDSSRYLVWEQLLFAESELNDHRAMANESARALQLFPQQPLLYLFAGAASFQLKEYDKAASYFRSGTGFVVGNDKLLAQFYAYLGDTYFQLDDVEASDKAYEKVLGIDPENSVVLNNYAYYLSLRGIELDRALEMARKAVDLDPENGANQDTYGWVLFKLGRFEESKEWIGKAILDPEASAVVLEHYGDVLSKLGDDKEALKYWEKALKAGKGSENLERKVKDKTYYE